MTFPAVFQLSSLDGTNGFAINGINAGDNSGSSVSSAGDINGDGFDDLLISARGADPNGSNSGQSYVVFGGGGSFSPSIDLSTLNGTNGFALNGINTNDYSGWSVSSAGDVNGDGFDDLIIGAYGADPNGSRSGQSYVVFGRSGGFSARLNLSTLNGTNGFAINGISAYDFSGRSVSSAGDVNGDGFDDLIIGANNADPNGRSGAGQSYVVFGRSDGFSASLNLSTLDGTNGFAINGINAFDYSGWSVSSAGDVNGDGFDDLIIGAFFADPNGNSSGQSYVVFGHSGGFSASLNLSTLNGTNGFALNGINVFDLSGYSVSNAGDVNSDGFDDLLIGSPNSFGSGQSYVVFGRSGGFSASLNLSTLNGTNGFALGGFNLLSLPGLGYSVSSAGDLNGDGFDDLIIGAYRANPNGSSSEQSYVVFGRSGGFSASLNLSTLNGTNGFAINGINANDYSGYSVSSAGDINGDGFDDLLIGAPGADPNGSGSSGQSYVVFGRRSTSAITLAVFPRSVTEDGATNLVYTFTRTENLTNPLTVNYSIGGTATNGTDYNAIGTSVTFVANSNTATVTVDPTADTVREANETVSLTLASGTGYAIETSTPVIGTITNDDVIRPSITLAVAPSSVTENGRPNLVYTFTRTGSLTNPLTVDYTISGAATNGIDYGGIGNSVLFVPGSSTATVTVDPTADSQVEADETVALTLAAGSGYIMGTIGAVTGTITNDDVALPTITLAVSPRSVTEDGATNLVYTFTRTENLTNPLIVNYHIGGTATNETDYDAIGTSVTFAANSSTATVTVDPKVDTVIEANETVDLTLVSGTGYTIGTIGAVTGTIADDDTPIITLSVNPSGISENADSDFVYIFTRTGLISSSLTVNFSVEGSATFNTDYTATDAPRFSATTGIVTFAAGASTATVTLNPTEDTIVETSETINLTLTNSAGYTVGTTKAVKATIINDDGTRRQRGTDGNDVILGTSRSDILSGGLGNDRLTGGENGDTFSFKKLTEGIDIITDFTPDIDSILIKASGFGGGLVAGDTISSAQFVIGTAATNSSQRLLYDSTSGALLFDRDGNKANTAVQFATLSPNLNLTFEDIWVT